VKYLLKEHDMKFEVYKAGKRIKTIEAKDVKEAAQMAGLTDPKFPALTSPMYGTAAWQWFHEGKSGTYTMEVIEA